MVRFSVCIPVWNDTSWLPRAIQSVVDQTHTDWELIVGDNASTEDVGAVVAAFGDPRIRHHRFDNHTNIFENFNRTCALATTDWIHLLAADDRIAPDCLARLAAVIESAATDGGRVAMAIGGCRRLDPDGRSADHVWYGTKPKLPVRTGRYSPESWLALCCEDGQPPWNLGSVSVARSVVDESGGYLRPELGLSNDFEMAMRVAAYGDVLYVDEPLLDFTVRSSSDGPARLQLNRSSGARETVVELAFVNALRVHEIVRVVSDAERAAVRAAIARSHLQRGAQHRVLPSGRGRRGAAADVWRALRIHPRTVLAPYNLAYAAASIVAPRRLLEMAKDRLSSRHASKNAAEIR